jgi:hypothetical protein
MDMGNVTQLSLLNRERTLPLRSGLPKYRVSIKKIIGVSAFQSRLDLDRNRLCIFSMDFDIFDDNMIVVNSSPMSEENGTMGMSCSDVSEFFEED